MIRSVEPGCAATVEMQLTDGVLSFYWTFEDLAESRSRITQRLALSTESAALVAQASVLEQSVPQGMNKVDVGNRGRSQGTEAGRVMSGRQTAGSIEAFHKINNLHSRPLPEAQARRANYLDNRGSTSARHLVGFSQL